MGRIKYDPNFICTICSRRFKDGRSYGRHMVKFHKLTEEMHTKGRLKGYNTGWWTEGKPVAQVQSRLSKKGVQITPKRPRLPR